MQNRDDHEFTFALGIENNAKSGAKQRRRACSRTPNEAYAFTVRLSLDRNKESVRKADLLNAEKKKLDNRQQRS